MLKSGLNKYDDFEFADLSSYEQALWWLMMHRSNGSGMIYIDAKRIARFLNLPSNSYKQAGELMNSLMSKYPRIYRSKDDENLYFISCKILDCHNMPLNHKKLDVKGILTRLFKNKSRFTHHEGFQKFYEDHIADIEQELNPPIKHNNLI